MTISIVQTLTPASVNNGASVQSSAFASSPTTGNTIIVVVGVYFENVTISDTAGNTYTMDKSTTSSLDTNRKVSVFRSSNITGGSTFKITATATSGTSFISFCAIEVAGLANSSPSDGSGSTTDSNGTGTTNSTGTFSTTNADDLIIAFTVHMQITGQTFSVTPSGFTGFGSITASGPIAIDAQYQIVAATQTNINPSWTVVQTDQYMAMGYAYKAAAGGASGNPWYYYANQALCSGGF